MARQNIKLGPFPKGKNNVQKETSIPQDSLNEALNVNITDDGKVERRKGYQRVYSGSNIHSFYSSGDLAIFVEGNDLKRLDNSFESATVIKANEFGPELLDYLELNGSIYYTCSYGTGVVKNNGEYSNLGVVPPHGQPTLIATSSARLQAGTYQVAITYLDSEGQESGTNDASVITIEDGQGILLQNIPQNLDYSSINVYATPPNGVTLYKQANIPMGTTSGTLSFLIEGDELLTQFGDVAPSGQYIDYYNGRLWIADGNVLWFSEPWRYGLFKYATNFIEFPEEIKFIKSLNTGMYVGSDKVYFLRGSSPDELTYKSVFDATPIHNTAIVVDTTLFNFENVFGKGVFLWSDKGALLGIEEGSVIPLSHKRYVPDEYDSGTSFLKAEDGITHIISSLTKKGNVSNLQTSDSASAEVIRHSITIEE